MDNRIELFSSCARMNGSATRLPARQNEKEGRLRIHVRNCYGVVLVSWIGHKIPQEVLNQIEEIERWTNVSSGLYNLSI